MAKKASKGKAKGPGKAKRSRSAVKDLPAASRKARTVKGGALTGKLSGHSIRSMNTI